MEKNSIPTMDMLGIEDGQHEKLKKQGKIIINEEFTPEMMQRVYFDIVDLAKNKNLKKIEIYINSNGGSVDALMPLIDIIKTCETPIHTIVMGKAYSCGMMLLMCGHKGTRFAHQHSEILIHDVAGGTSSKNEQFQEDAKYMQRIHNQLSDIILERTKMTKTQVEKYMNSNKDIFITSQQALKYGVIDKII